MMTEKSDDRRRPHPRVAVQALFWVLCFGSILILLLHLSGQLRMNIGAAVVLLPSIVFMAWIYWKACRAGKEARTNAQSEFARRIELGFIGGLLGTLGYDLFRIPFHYAGMNVFAPIYAYGMWSLGAEQSSVASDAVGFVYHLSNGITFGLIYSLVLTRRSWAWAIPWALALETLAVVTTFGAVFSIRSYSAVVIIAFVAHLFYGLPLGVVCERFADYRPARIRLIAVGSIVLSLLVGIWFVNASYWFAGRPDRQHREIVLGMGAIGPRWSDYQVGTEIGLRNLSEDQIVVLVRSPNGDAEAEPEEIPLGVERAHVFIFERPGIYQFGVRNSPARSVFVSVHQQGKYAPRITDEN